MTQRRFISIKFQFMIIAMLLVTISSTLWGWWAWQNERDLLYHNLESEGAQVVASRSSPIINALLYEEMGVIEEGGLLDNFIEEIMNNPSLVITSALVWGPPPWRPYSFTKKKDLPGMRALTNFLTTSPQNWNSCISSFSEKRKLCRRESRSVQDCIAKNRKIFAAVSSINVFLHCAEI